MQRSSLQLVLRVADNGPPITEVERYMASFTALLIHTRGEVALLGNCLDLRMNSFPLTMPVSDIYVRNATA